MNQKQSSTKKYVILEVSGEGVTRCRSYDSASDAVASLSRHRGRPAKSYSVSGTRKKYSRDQEIKIGEKIYVSRKAAARMLGTHMHTVVNAVHAAERGENPLVVIHPTGTRTNYIEKRSIKAFVRSCEK